MDHLQASADAIGGSLEQIAVVGSARRQAEELVALLVDLNGTALERLLELSGRPDVFDSDPELHELLWVHRPAPPSESLFGAAERADQALSALEQCGIPGVVEEAGTLVDEVNELYGRGLMRAVELLATSGAADALAAALADEMVAGALVLHGLHPLDLRTRAQDAIDRLTADEAVVGPRASVARIDGDATVVISVDGEPYRDRWRVAVAAERAVRSVAPDAADVVVIGAEPEAQSSTGTEAFIPLSSVGRRGHKAPARWVGLPELGAIEPGEAARLVADGLQLLACRVGADLYVALDPFSGHDGVGELTVETGGGGPPVVTATHGVRFAFDAPLPVHRDGDHYEVSVP